MQLNCTLKSELVSFLHVIKAFYDAEDQLVQYLSLGYKSINLLPSIRRVSVEISDTLGDSYTTPWGQFQGHLKVNILDIYRDIKINTNFHGN